MRIGHYAFDPTSPGGMASYIRRLGSAQQARGDDVILLARDEPTAPNGFPISVAPTEAALFNTASALDLDVLHLHHPIRGAVPEARVPTVRTMHDNSASCPSGSTFLATSEQPCNRAFTYGGCLWGHLVDHCGSRRPHNVTKHFRSIRQEQALLAELPTMTVSAYMRDAIVRSGGRGDRITVVPSPAPALDETVVPPPREDPPRFVFAGRIEPKKGLDWFLRALARCPGVRADVAGSGADVYVDAMKRRADTLGLTDRVTFHGWLAEADVYALYRGARAVVFPSIYHEPAGLVTLEAAALGRAVITSRVGGIPEYAHPSFALLCEPGDVAGLAAHMTTLANDWAQAQRMGAAGVAIMKTRHAMGPFLDTVDRVYQQAMAPQNRSVPPARHRHGPSPVELPATDG